MLPFHGGSGFCHFHNEKYHELFIIFLIISFLCFLKCLRVKEERKLPLIYWGFLVAKYTSLLPWRSVHNSDAWLTAGKGSTLMDYRVNVWLY